MHIHGSANPTETVLLGVHNYRVWPTLQKLSCKVSTITVCVVLLAINTHTPLHCSIPLSYKGPGHWRTHSTSLLYSSVVLLAIDAHTPLQIQVLDIGAHTPLHCSIPLMNAGPGHWSTHSTSLLYSSDECRFWTWRLAFATQICMPAL